MSNIAMIKKLANFDHYEVECPERDYDNPEGNVSGTLNNVAFSFERDKKVLMSKPLIDLLQSSKTTVTKRVERDGRMVREIKEISAYPLQVGKKVTAKTVQKYRMDEEFKTPIIPDHNCLMDQKAE